jgi:tRNA-2-methylthio-N6-dimethylallyladenosine synthase
MPDQIPADVVTERFDRLVALANDIAWQENKAQIGKEVHVLVANGEGKKDEATQRISGRSEDFRLVHVAKPAGLVRPGDIVTATVTSAAPYHLIADENVTVRKTRAGDLSQQAAGSSLLQISGVSL